MSKCRLADAAHEVTCINMLPEMDDETRAFRKHAAAVLVLALENCDEALQLGVVVLDSLEGALGQRRQARVVTPLLRWANILAHFVIG